MKITYPNNVIGNLILEIKRSIAGTKYDNHIFLCDECVRDILLKRNMNKIKLCIDLPNGSGEFANWLCQEYNCLSSTNPFVFPNLNISSFVIKTIHSFANIRIECVDLKENNNLIDKLNLKHKISSLVQDALLRDFTINALYVNLSNDEIIDPLNLGLTDIENKIIRTTINPSISYEFNSLRLFQTIHLASDIHYNIEKKTWMNVILKAHLISNIPKETIATEINKILLIDKPSIAFNRLLRSGILDIILPDINNLVGIQYNKNVNDDVFNHTLSIIDNTKKELILRWGCLLHEIGKSLSQTINPDGKIDFLDYNIIGAKLALKICRNFKFPQADIRNIIYIVKYHNIFGDEKYPNKRKINEFIKNVKKGNINLVLDAIEAHYQNDEQIQYIKKEINRLQQRSKVSSFVTGDDIMNFFHIKSSHLVGKILHMANEYSSKNPNMTKEMVLSEIKTQLAL